MRELSREQRTYELMTILHPDVSEDDLPGALDRVASHVTGVGGEVTETLRDSPWGRRRLAYPIRNAGRDIRDGYYSVFHLTLDPGQVDDMEQELKLNTQVIRYLVTSYSPVPLDPRAIEQAEIAAEDEAAAAYAAAQAAAARQATQRNAPAERARPADIETPDQAVATSAAAVDDSDQPDADNGSNASTPAESEDDEPPASDATEPALAEAEPATDNAPEASSSGVEPEEG